MNDSLEFAFGWDEREVPEQELSEAMVRGAAK